MTFAKIKSGIAPFDELFEGFYLGQPTLLSGRRGSGTTTIALRFLSHLVRIGEKVLLFTDQPPSHVGLAVHGLGTDIAPALDSEQLTIVPYDEQLPLLPFPEALDELRVLVADRHFSFVVFDPVVPWLAAPADRLADRLDAFFGVLSDTSATALLLLHHPVSKLARRLFDEVSERCAVSLAASRSHDGTHALEVSKYMGEPPGKCPVLLHLASSTGDTPADFGVHPGTPSVQDFHAVPHLPESPHRFSASASASASFFPAAQPSSRPAAPAATPQAAFPAAFAAVPQASPAKPKAATPAPSAASAAFSGTQAAFAAVPQAAPAAPAAPKAAPAKPNPLSFSGLRREDNAFFASPAPALQPPEPAAPPSAPREIHFANAQPDMPPSPKAPFQNAPPPPPPRVPAPPIPVPPAPGPSPADGQSRQGHPIRFSDIIQ
jgi:archaellum biogenesis ATPase FlaH